MAGILAQHVRSGKKEQGRRRIHSNPHARRFKLASSMRCGSGNKWSGLLSLVGAAIVTTTIFRSSICLADVKDGYIDLPGSELHAGKIYDLDGQWLYKPGYAIGDTEQPDKTPDQQGY